MRRGEVRLVDFEPIRGSESNKTRPAIVVSNDGANTAAQRLGRGVITVVPITSNIATVRPFQVLITTGTAGLISDSKAQCEQVRSVAVERVGRVLGLLPAAHMADVGAALRLHLDL